MPNLIDVGIDFETYYSKEYTLKNLTIPEYVLDSRFEAIGVSIKLPGQPAKFFDQPRMAAALGKIPWDRVRMIAHHAFFDGAILEWRFAYKPTQYFCTMMGSRPFVAPYTGSMSLASVAKHLGTGVKGHEVTNALGKRYADFEPIELQAYAAYCNNDNEITCGAAAKLLSILPPDEQDLVDLTVKKFTRPKLVLDATAIDKRMADIEAKRHMIEAKAALCGCSPPQLRSRPQFAAALKKLGVKPPEKLSLRTGKPTHAFAKNDQDFIELLTHNDARVRTLVEAKLFTSSTLEVSRLERFKTLYNLDVGAAHQLPVPLLYYGAHPGRFSGYDKINLQNLTRVSRDKASKEVTAGHLRFALKAPPGYSVVAGDLSNIEARLVATLARCFALVLAYRQKRDIYAEFASKIYGRPIDKKKDEIERFVGKTCILGLGYGMGWAKFLMQMKIARVKMTPEMAQRIVYLYRNTYPEIPDLWAQIMERVYKMLSASCLETYGPVSFAHERIILPNGMPLLYPGLHRTADQEVHFKVKRGRGESAAPGISKLWGGAVTENIVQALARIVISTAELRLARLGLKAVLQVHDELVYVVRNEHVEAVTKALELALTAPVSWLPELPLACEIKHGDTYGDAK
jgi:DNA polymerase